MKIIQMKMYTLQQIIVQLPNTQFFLALTAKPCKYVLMLPILTKMD